MDEMHPNSLALLKLDFKAHSLGYEGDFSRDVAYKMGEEGNEYPSTDALLLAEKMIEKLKKEGD